MDCTQDCDQGRECSCCPTTRTYPRTLAEAFPYAPAPLQDQDSELAFWCLMFGLTWGWGFVLGLWFAYL